MLEEVFVAYWIRKKVISAINLTTWLSFGLYALFSFPVSLWSNNSKKVEFIYLFLVLQPRVDYKKYLLLVSEQLWRFWFSLISVFFSWDWGQTSEALLQGALSSKGSAPIFW